MKKRTKIIIGLAALCAGTMTLAACSGSDWYQSYVDDGFVVSIRYDVNGGIVWSKPDTVLVDRYQLEDVQRGVKLLAPDDERRVDRNRVAVSRDGYFLAGWYQTRELRTDESGAPLDEFGSVCNIEQTRYDSAGNVVYGDNGEELKELVSENGRTQGYTYSGKWDFETDEFQLDDYTYTPGEYTFTLYAAWVPEYTYEIYGETENEEGETSWEVYASKSYNPNLSDTLGEIAVPKWDEETGALEYGEFPKPSDLVNATLVSTYSDPEMTEEVTSIVNRGEWDSETATCTGGLVKYYAKWDEGIWYHIHTAEQFFANAGERHSYEFFSDIDFAGKEWPETFSRGTYSGMFRGKGVTLSNITVTQKDIADTRGGLFGVIGSAASFEDITFSNVTYRLEYGSNDRNRSSMFGLFAGELSSEATIKNVKVSGELVIGKDVYLPRPFDPDTGTYGDIAHYYDVGLLTGNLVTGGISFADISVRSEAGHHLETDPATGLVTIS